MRWSDLGISPFCTNCGRDNRYEFPVTRYEWGEVLCSTCTVNLYAYIKDKEYEIELLRLHPI